VLDQALDSAGIRRFILERLAPHLAGYLYQQRWFGDKDRPLAGVSLVDVAVDAAEQAWFVLAVATVQFDDGSAPADYLLVAAVIPDVGWTETTLVRLATPDGDWQVADIAAAPAFPTWWLSKFAVGEALPGTRGTFSWQRFAGFAEAVIAAGPGTLILGGMGQSNTTIRYADAMFGKIFRRLREGINPDEEISRALAEQTDFRQLPIPYGSASYQAGNGATYPVGVLFSFVPSVAEGWEWTQRFLTQEPLPSYAGPARGLGQRTGQLHLALASVTADPAFAPEPVSASDVAEWERQTTADVRAIATDLRTRAPNLAPAARQVVDAVLTQQDQLLARVTGYQALAGTVKTRIHGDYHLGQVLRTPDDDWVLLDFEGEPARTIAQRRAKTAPMKDVADMLRSFGYARGMAARSPGADDGRLLAWEREARQGFLTGYRDVVAAAPAPLVPADDAQFASAVAAWELAKAIYEVRYELGNRPDWLDVPLRSLIVGG
jgi:maltose alpha-D-glucosyltransferase/alpha-amylase